MGFNVVVCEVATGIACYLDGRYYLESDGPLPATPFGTLGAAEQWCEELLTSRPELECVVRDASGQTQVVYRPDSSGRPQVAYRRPEPAEPGAAADGGA